jgi:hypothetical protein
MYLYNQQKDIIELENVSDTMKEQNIVNVNVEEFYVDKTMLTFLNVTKSLNIQFEHCGISKDFPYFELECKSLEFTDCIGYNLEKISKNLKIGEICISDLINITVGRDNHIYDSDSLLPGNNSSIVHNVKRDTIIKKSYMIITGTWASSTGIKSLTLDKDTQVTIFSKHKNLVKVYCKNIRENILLRNATKKRVKKMFFS